MNPKRKPSSWVVKNPADVDSIPSTHVKLRPTGVYECPGKDSGDPEDSLRKGKLPKAQPVKTADEGKRNEAYAIDHGDGKKRDASTNGISRETIKTAKKLGGSK